MLMSTAHALCCPFCVAVLIKTLCFYPKKVGPHPLDFMSWQVQINWLVKMYIYVIWTSVTVRGLGAFRRKEEMVTLYVLRSVLYLLRQQGNKMSQS